MVVPQTQWISSNTKEVLAKAFCYGAISVACFGAAASSFLIIPGFINLLPFSVPFFFIVPIYIFAIVNGISYAISQFWDGFLEKTRVNIFKLAPSAANSFHQKANEKLKEEITELLSELTLLPTEVNPIGFGIYKNETITLHNERLQQYLSIIVNTLPRDTIPQHLTHLLPIESYRSPVNLGFKLNCLYYLNYALCTFIVTIGISTSIILTLLGTTKALEALGPLILGYGISSNTSTFLATFVAMCTQFCKSSSFGQRQWNVLMLSIFKIDTTPKMSHQELHNHLKLSKSEIERINQIKDEFQNLDETFNFIRMLELAERPRIRPRLSYSHHQPTQNSLPIRFPRLSRIS